MRKVNRIKLFAGVVLSVLCIATLAACGGRRSQTESIPTNPPQATAAPQKAQPTTVPAPAQPTTVPAVEQATATALPTATLEPAATATVAPAKSSESGAALEQMLEQLFNANNSADQLDDVPQVK
ncbi:MAG: hypothetical protein HY870_19915 [Chloroflexi bacterium]|nr:hypothetical protein [Chloroflexota bacterium]